MKPSSHSHDATPAKASLPIAMEGGYRRALETARVRTIIVGLLFAVACIGVCLRLAEIATFRDAETRSARFAGLAAPKPSRADIVDRNGELLATTLSYHSLYANPSEVRRPADAARALHGVLPHVSEATLLERLTRSGQFSWIDRQISPRQKAEIMQLGIVGLGSSDGPRALVCRALHLAATEVGARLEGGREGGRRLGAAAG